MNNKNIIIELHDVKKIYNRGSEKIHALDGINLTVKKGEFISVVGPSGSGKTTLLNVIGCMDTPTNGTVILNGQNVTNLNENKLSEIRRDTIGFVFQQFLLIPTLTVLENVQIPALFANNSSKIEKAKNFLDIVGMGHRLNHFPTQISGGEMQRVAVARALVNSPSILIADEPTGNLDTKNSTVIMKILKKLNKTGVTIIMVTHNTALAKTAERIIYIKDGKLTTAPKKCL